MSGREAAVSAGLLAAAAVLVARARVRAARERRRASPYVPRPLHYWDYPSFPLVASPLAPEAEFASALAQIREERTQQMLVVANGDDTTAVAACALMLEPKFLRGGSWVAHLASILPPMQPTIPDMARAYRTLLREALERARSAGCYKAIFDSSTPAESELMLEMGFVLSQLAMQRDLRPASARGPAAELPASPALPKLDGGQLRDMQLRSLVSSDSAAYIQLLKQVPSLAVFVCLNSRYTPRDGCLQRLLPPSLPLPYPRCPLSSHLPCPRPFVRPPCLRSVYPLAMSPRSLPHAVVPARPPVLSHFNSAVERGHPDGSKSI